VIDAGCSAAAALSIAADDVRVRRVTVRGGTFYTIDLDNRMHVELRDVISVESAFVGCGGVQYGINVFASTHVRLTRCTVIGDNNGYTGAWGYQDAGMYIGGIPAAGNVRVKRGLVVGNHRGLIIEDAVGGPGATNGVRVQRLLLPSNGTAIFLHNSDGVRIERNVANDARGSHPAVGIEIDATSDDNLIRKNSFSGAVTDVIDDGTSNCWNGNTVGTGTVPSDGCD
jgi:hypothetical protein